MPHPLPFGVSPNSSLHNGGNIKSFWSEQRQQRQRQRQLRNNGKQSNINNMDNHNHNHNHNNEVKFDETVDTNLDKLKKLYDCHIYYVIETLCRFEGLMQWTDKIYDYAMRTNEVVEHTGMAMEFHDIRHYIKVKRLQGGTIDDCRFIDGVAFRHNIAHRKMRTNINNPKILLLDCAIEYHRMNSKFHSFDILLKQEEEYMEMIVDKIKDLGPDIVVVANEVSTAAQSYMCRENITLIKGIDASIMERLARSIRAPVITSIDHINQLSPAMVLGTCQRFYVEYCKEDPLYV